MTKQRKLYSTIGQNPETANYFLLSIGQPTLHFDTMQEAHDAIVKIRKVWDLDLTDDADYVEWKEFAEAVESTLKYI